MSTDGHAQRGRLIIERERLAWMDTLRSYRVLVDGEMVGRLRNGETREYPLRPGRHTVQVRIDWTGSEPEVVNALEGHPVHLMVRWRGNLFSRRRYLALKPILD